MFLLLATAEETDERNDESKEDLNIPDVSEDEFEEDERAELELDDKESGI